MMLLDIGGRSQADLHFGKFSLVAKIAAWRKTGVEKQQDVAELRRCRRDMSGVELLNVDKLGRRTRRMN